MHGLLFLLKLGFVVCRLNDGDNRKSSADINDDTMTGLCVCLCVYVIVRMNMHEIKMNEWRMMCSYALAKRTKTGKIKQLWQSKLNPMYVCKHIEINKQWLRRSRTLALCLTKYIVQ